MTAAPVHGTQSSPICEMYSEQILILAENQDKISRLFGTPFQLEYQMEFSPEDAKCIDESVKKLSEGKYRFTPSFDHEKGYYFKIELTPQYVVSN